VYRAIRLEFNNYLNAVKAEERRIGRVYATGVAVTTVCGRGKKFDDVQAYPEVLRIMSRRGAQGADPLTTVLSMYTIRASNVV
jgi:hypothetical protein